MATAQVNVTTAAARALVERVLRGAGIRVNGDHPWDIRVHDSRFFARAVIQGTLGIGESYMEGWWDCDQIDEMVARTLRASVDHGMVDWRKKLLMAGSRIANLQSVVRANQVAEVHYDLGNDFFEQMLGPSMNYSCGYWREATELDDAQYAKMDLICRKLQLSPGEKLLDIGCGWGALIQYAAENFGVECTGITVSRQQRAYAAQKNAHLPNKVLLCDYRSEELTRLGPFDRIVSVGMFEHVGRKNYGEFMRVARSLLADGGIFLLHTIGNDHSPTDAWLNRYIFPNGELPSTVDLTRAATGVFLMEDWHNLRADYDKTILGWLRNFENYVGVQSVPPRFYRMWRYYLQIMAGSFRAQTRNQLWQVVYTPRSFPGGYVSVR